MTQEVHSTIHFFIEVSPGALILINNNFRSRRVMSLDCFWPCAVGSLRHGSKKQRRTAGITSQTLPSGAYQRVQKRDERAIPAPQLQFFYRRWKLSCCFLGGNQFHHAWKLAETEPHPQVGSRKTTVLHRPEHQVRTVYIIDGRVYCRHPVGWWATLLFTPATLAM